jgi:hypothetical protein
MYGIDKKEKEPSNSHKKVRNKKKKKKNREFINLSTFHSNSIRLYVVCPFDDALLFFECSSLLLLPVRYGRDKPRSDFRKDRSMTIRWWWCYLLINIVCVCLCVLSLASPLWGQNKTKKKRDKGFLFYYFFLSFFFFEKKSMLYILSLSAGSCLLHRCDGGFIRTKGLCSQFSYIVIESRRGQCVVVSAEDEDNKRKKGNVGIPGEHKTSTLLFELFRIRKKKGK